MPSDNNRSGKGWRLIRPGLCVVIAMLITFLPYKVATLASRADPTSARFLHNHWALTESVLMLTSVLLWLILAYLFSGSPSPKAFVDRMSLNVPPDRAGWLLSLAAVALASIELFAVASGEASSNHTMNKFRDNGAAAWLFFGAYTIVISPFVEETFLRGYIYAAFRQIIGAIPSMLIVIAIQGYFHSELLKYDAIYAITFVLGGLVLCMLRERTKSTWNCVLFHASYNAVVTRHWEACLVGLIAIAPTCFSTIGGCLRKGPFLNVDKSSERTAAPNSESDHKSNSAFAASPDCEHHAERPLEEKRTKRS